MLDLDAIDAALAAMTPEPWGKHPYATAHVNAGERGICSCSCYSNNQDPRVTEQNEANADGIVLLRNIAREMVDEIRRLRELVGEAADCLMGDNRDRVPELWSRLDKTRRGEL